MRPETLQMQTTYEVNDNDNDNDNSLFIFEGLRPITYINIYKQLELCPTLCCFVFLNKQDDVRYKIKAS